MKNLAINIMFLVVVTTGAKAQDTVFVQRADFANWVIESNVKTPKKSVVKFYNQQQELIYQEEIKNKRLNVRRTKLRNKLNQVLAQLVAKNAQITEGNLVAISLKRN